MKRITKRKLLGLLLACALLLQLAGCAGADAPAAPTHSAQPANGTGVVDLMAGVKPAAAEKTGISPESAAAVTDFSLRILRAGSKPGENSLLSPVSVLCALAMTANGAKGETLAQMERTLGLPLDRLNEFFESWRAVLEGDTALQTANSVWFTDRESFTVNPDFLQVNADRYGAELYQAPFTDETLKQINAWVKEKTNGMIPEILDQINPDAVMYLVNALAFEGKWEQPYPSYAVDKNGSFTCADGSKRSVEMMGSTEYQYLENELLTGFVKPYQGRKYAFAALLPKEGVSVEELLQKLDGAALQKLLQNRTEEIVFTALPKFETRYEAELSEVLTAMGMELPFDAGSADLSGIGSSAAGKLYISRVLHKTFLAVDEEGTRAGAATAVEAASGAAMVDYKTVNLDRPFVYLLMDCESCLPLFLGTMMDPAASAG